MNHLRLQEVLPRRASLSRVALTSFTIAASAIFYSPVSSAVLFDELTKSQLSEIRGKFLNNNTLQYFGLSMNTTWGTASGSTNSSGLALGFDLSGSSPSVSVTRSGSVGEKIETRTVIEPDAALQQISGSVQSIQAAGNGNTLGNQLDLDVNANDGILTNSSDTNLGAGVETYQADNGVVTQFTNTGNTIGYAMKNDTAIVVQQLGANSFNNNQLLQPIRS